MNLTHWANLYAAVTIFAVLPAAAQDHNGVATQSQARALAPTMSPYAGKEKRHVKALSDQQIADLQAGRGMGLSLAAELNGYPGPSHVLELADGLQLSDMQRARTKVLLEAMKAETIRSASESSSGKRVSIACLPRSGQPADRHVPVFGWSGGVRQGRRA